MKKIKAKIYKVLSNKKLLSKLKPCWFMFSLMLFASTMVFAPDNNPGLYIILGSLTLVSLMILNKLIDDLYITLILDDISKSNQDTMRSLGTLSYEFNRMNEMQDEVIKDYARYYVYWNLLKKMAKQSENDDFKKMLADVESMVDPIVEKKF